MVLVDVSDTNMATLVQKISRPVSSLQPCVCWAFCHRWNSNRASITKPDRKIYVRMYQSRFVLPDGSTIRVRYHEPRKCIKLPVDITLLSEEELADRYRRLAPPKKVKQIEEVDIEFDESQYANMVFG